MNIVRTTHRIEPRFVLDPFEPAYLSLLAEEIGSRVEAGLSELEDCCACPRNCHVNRMANETNVCNTGQYGPAYEVGAIACNGRKKYDEINRRPGQHEMLDAYAAARDARLWRFDERWLR